MAATLSNVNLNENDGWISDAVAPEFQRFIIASLFAGGVTMKILHVIPSVDPDSGGPAEGLRQLCTIYRMGGHEIEVASLDSPEYARKCDFPAHVHGMGPGWGIYGFSHRAAPWFKKNIRHYDVVFINCIWQYNTVAAYRGLHGTGIPYAVFTHGMLDPYFKQRYPLKHVKKAIYWHCILRKILHGANMVLFTCEEEKILARQSFSRYQVREMVVPYGTFGPGCDTAAAAEEFLALWPHLRGKRLAISMGRIHPKKALDILIEAFAATLAKDPAWHLVIAGPDEVGWQKVLEAFAANLGIADRITWTGMLKGTLKWGAFTVSEVFVLPSHQENFGIVVAEALACSLPVILSDKVNIWREVMSYRAGLVGRDTTEGTADSLRRWSELTSGEIADMRSQSRKCFDELFNFNVTSRKVLENVEHLVQANPRYTPLPPDASTVGNHKPLRM
jgi:glycosyltransferase involved in cell wall biosynthesis